MPRRGGRRMESLMYAPNDPVLPVGIVAQNHKTPFPIVPSLLYHEAVNARASKPRWMLFPIRVKNADK